MATIGTHRARVIATPAEHTGHTVHAQETPHAPHAQLSRQAALFQRLRASGAGVADVESEAQAEPEREEAPASAHEETALYEADPPQYGLETWHRDDTRENERGGTGNGDQGGSGGSSDDSDADNSRAQYAIPSLAVPPVPMHMWATLSARMPQTDAATQTANAAQAAERDADRALKTVTAISATASAGDAVHQLLDSIVAEVADFCANAAVTESGNWQITIPVDPNVLPGCTLSLALSHLALTLRFETTDERTRQVISEHAATLRTSLEQVMQSRFDGTRSVEIIIN